MPFENATLLGNYGHFFKDSIFEDNVSFAYSVGLASELKCLPLHVRYSDYKWFDVRVF